MNKLILKISMIMAAIVGLVAGSGGVSFADTLAPQPADPSAGSLAAGVNSARTWVTTYGVPAMLAAIVFGVLVRAGFRWVRRVTGKATA